MKRNDWGRKQTQVVLRDLEAWVQQLYESHRVRVELICSLPVPGDGVQHGVTLVAFRVDGRGKRDECHRDWLTISDTTTGSIEAAGCRMVSRLLLDLEADQERAERTAQLPLWR